MTDKQHSSDDDFFDRTLRPIDADAAPVNEAQMAEAIKAAGDAFLSDHERESVAGGANPQLPSAADNVHSASENNSPRKARTMFAFAKPIAVLTASAAMFVVAWFSVPGPVSADVTLGRVLDLALNAKTLQIKAVTQGKEAEVLISGDSVRWQEAPGRYRIANGTRLWKVDEAADDVSETTNPWVTDHGDKIDLVAMLGSASSPQLRNSRPLRQTEHAGVLCNVFQFEPTQPASGLVIRAFANAKTHELYSIAAWPHGVPVGRGAPVAELTLTARNIVIDESQFMVGSTLSEDNRVGKIREAQGIVLLRPKTLRRWTPVTGAMLLKTGDWIRTDVRGANAASVELTSGYRLILGPGSLLEVDGSANIMLHRGEVQITGSGQATADLQVAGPQDQNNTVSAGNTHHLRLDRNEKFVIVEHKPLWLAGFEGSSSNESIGALIANIDGRDVPLTVGFHKVKVEIRDQIARTTIEESFVNRTRTRLEGVFHFPLPQDASISGFGMWINGELIEADVVEKQRAREIYETILREKRDPGLLEWAGGNIFKARVFPIEPHSEKRIKIVYTQVLPMRANRYRYSYGLRSEMLQKTPLRELSLEVLVHSALKLKSVDCSTHAVRSQLTDHSASLEFSAQEYTPTRDFELVCEVDDRESDVVVVPHRRGDDGYFLAQITPPTGAGNWQRELLPDGDPLRLLVVCDTSASMNSQDRELQQQFVSSVLTSLGENDQFSVAVCDVGTHWNEKTLVAATAEQVDAAVAWLSQRRSLGWTDLDRMAKSVIKRLNDAARENVSRNQHTHVIYIGDGIVTAHDADPQAFINRIGRITSGVRRATFHAVSVGSSFESGVLKSLAAVGGGSVRQIDGEQTPQRVALELLNEVARPGLRDLKVEVKGLQVAAVYPSELPNLVAGTQQIVIGRYLPTGDDQSGEIIVSGTRNGEPVRYSSRVTLSDAERGNSFIPRLWARSHLDHLLHQGSNEFLRSEIIALSEEFHIMTPYTSLLVLETDEDRERFGVKRRFLMRDGEKFFADGRSRASFELVQQQMKAAGNWRLGLRRQILSYLAGLGRDVGVFEDHGNELERLGRITGLSSLAGLNAPQSSSRARSDFSGVSESSNINGGFGGKLGFDFDGSDRLADYETDENAERAAESDSEFTVRQLQDEIQLNMPALLAAEQPMSAAKKEKSLRQSSSRGLVAGKRLAQQMSDLFYRDSDRKQLQQQSGEIYSGSGRYASPSQYTAWLNQLFPAIPVVSEAPKLVASKWPENAQKIAAQLQQPLQLQNDTGLQVVLSTDVFDVRWDRLSSQHQTAQYYLPDRWLEVSAVSGPQTTVQWCTKDTRGIYSKAFQLGRTRKSTDRDVSSLTPGNRPYAAASLEQTYATYDAEVKNDADDRVVLVLSHPTTTPAQQLHITIDTVRNVVLKTEWRVDGSATSTTEYSDYAEVAGCWWPETIRSRDAKGRLTSTVRQTVVATALPEFNTQFQSHLPDSQTVVLLKMPLPTVSEARVAVAGGAAELEDHLVLLLNASRIQNWEAAIQHLQDLESTADNKPGRNWIRLATLISARRNEDARQLATSLLQALTADAPSDELGLANHLLNQMNQVVDQNELLTLLDVVKPVYERQPEHLAASRQWKQRRVSALNRLGRKVETLELYRDLAASAPWDISAQTTYAQQLAATGEYPTARAWLRKEIDRDVEHQPYEQQMLRTSLANLLRQEYLIDELVSFLAEWIAEEPENDTAYSQYLGALMTANRPEQADALALKWMTEARRPKKLSLAVLARLRVGYLYALGQVYGVNTNQIDLQWHQPLSETAIYFLTHQHHFEVVQRILSHYQFATTEAAARVRKAAAQQLRATAAELDPSRLANSLGWTLRYGDLTETDWTNIGETLYERWTQTKDTNLRQLLGAGLVRIYATTAPDTLWLPFLRERVQRARDDDDQRLVDQFLSELFDTLLTRTWTQQIEDEAFDLLPQLFGTKEMSPALFARVPALYRMVDSLLAARIAVDETELKTSGHAETLSRTELAAKQRTFVRAARLGLIDRLNVAADRLREDDDTGLQGLADWMQMERMYLQVLLADMPAPSGDQPEALAIDNAALLNLVREECWKILADIPIVSTDELIDTMDEADSENQAAETRLLVLRQHLRERAFVMISNLTLRRSAPDGAAERLLADIDRGIALGGTDEKIWKSQRASLLIGLDRPEELEKNLRQWIRNDEYPAPYQMLLARLLAEQGKIADAIDLFETVERRETLDPSDYAALANWYMAVDRQDDYQRARIQVFKSSEEWKISQWISQQRQPWYRTDVPLPTELDENVLFAFQALFEKSNNPGNYVYQLKDFYTACRDFRLLQMVPDSVRGRTPQQIYSFLMQLQTQLLPELRNEATADSVMERLAAARASVETDVDKRALDLLEAMIERRSATVLNQPGPHIAAAVAALKRAFDGDWAEGEVVQMATFLTAMGTIEQPALAAERLRQLRALFEMTTPGTTDRFQVAWQLTSALYWSHNRHDEAIAVMESGLREYRAANPGGLSSQLNESFDGFMGLLENRKLFSQAESELQHELEQPVNANQKFWMLNRLNQLYHRTLQNRGQVSLGSGDELYKNLLARLLKQARSRNDNYSYQTLSLINAIFQTAHNLKISDYQQDFRRFAFRQFPTLLNDSANNYRNIVDSTADVVHQLLTPRDSVQFLIEHMEDYPARFENTWEHPWQRLGWRMAQWRHQAKQDLSDLEPRLLKILLTELRRDLTTQKQRNRSIYDKRSGYFWAAKAQDFARVADEVVAAHLDSGQTLVYSAQYLFHELQLHNRSLEVLLAAYDRGVLDVPQQIILVDLLFERDRHPEAIPLLTPIVRDAPDEMSYRTRLLTAYTKAKRPQQAQQLLAATEEHFRQPGRWTEANVAKLAHSCMLNRLFEPGVRFYGEVIPLHQRTQPNRGIGDGVLSEYYSWLALGYSGLGRTIEAVDAAAAGVVAWGPRHDQRTGALQQLEDVIAKAEDLDDYVRHMDQQAAEHGTDSPIIRKKIGMVYASRGKHQQAVAQLKIAADLQPYDSETQQALIAAYEALQDHDAVVRQMLAQLDFDRHNLALYRQLADKLKDDEAEAERAATTLVEAAPLEASHHQALAELREQQNRWNDAIAHWKHVTSLRSLEPNGLIQLAEAQIHQQQWSEAGSTLKSLAQKEWPQRFREVPNELRRLQNLIPQTP